MRLKIKIWLQDESGFVLVFSGLALPVILLLAVVVIQTGQLYVRQAELQFMAQQSANSALLQLAGLVQTQAESNYRAQCSVFEPPFICSSDDWRDFITPAELQSLVNLPSTKTLIETEIQRFLGTSDAIVQAAETSVVFPVFETGNRVSAQVNIAETQTDWLGNVLRPNPYALQVQSKSYLAF